MRPCCVAISVLAVQRMLAAAFFCLCFASETVVRAALNATDFDAMAERIRSLCDVDDDRFWMGKFSGGAYGGYSGIRTRWNSRGCLQRP